jgi:predicted nucleotidyltransferase
MQKNLQKKPELSYSSNVLDIVQFGSSIFESSKPSDIDIAVIFKNIPLKQQLEEAQKIKRQLETRFDLPIHIKSYDFYSFFDKGNFSRENILFYGKSLLYHGSFAENLGLISKLQIYYSLKNLKKKDKIKFNYLLKGRGGKYGLLRKYGGFLVKPGMIEINPKYEKIFSEQISLLISDFVIKKVLLNK